MKLRSNTYQKYMLLTISVLLIALLLTFAVAIYLGTERVVSGMQQKASRKMLASINYNIKAMETLLGSLSVSAASDKNMISLMYGDMEKNKLEWVQGYSKMYELVQSTSILHSITAYNGRMDDFFSSSDTFMLDPEAYKHSLRKIMTQEDKPLMRGQLTPLAIEDIDGRVQAFSYYWFDSVQNYRPGLSFLSFNIKASWIFDNLKAVDDSETWESKEEGGVFMLDKSGRVYAADGSQLQDTSGLLQQIKQHAAGNENGGGFFRGQYLDKNSWISYRTSDITSWTFVIVKPYEKVMVDLLRMRSTFFWITIAMLFVAFLSALLAVHQLYKPVRHVVSNIRKRISVPVPEARQNELEYLSTVYDTLSEQLNDALQEQMNKRNIVAAYYVKQLITGGQRFSAEQLEEYRTAGLLTVGADRKYRLILLKLDRFRALSCDLSDSELRLLAFAIVNIAGELASSEFGCETVEVQSDSFVILLHSPADHTISTSAAVDIAGRIQQVVSQYYHVSLSAAVGEQIHELARISDSYDSLKQQIQYRLIYGRGSVITPQMLPVDVIDTPLMSYTIEKKLTEALRSGQSAVVHATLADLREQAVQQDTDTIMRIILHLTHTIKVTVHEINAHRLQPLSVSLGDLSRELMELETLDEVFERLTDVTDEFIAKLKSPDNDRNESLVASVKRIIENSYTDLNLNVQSIADELKLSAGHIGRIFKQYERVSVAEYINQIRMQRALELLTNGKYSVNEIMMQVGYANQSYFFKLFKKTFGTTPREFRLSRARVSEDRIS